MREAINEAIGETLNEAVCPLCGGVNACAGSRACWCAGEAFPEGLFAFVPPEARGRACICRFCLESYKETGHPLRKETRAKESGSSGEPSGA
ncbi:cysteine-rich CWC family protein [Paenibacillus sp. MWE-103]|uniref:Cysteine-rich CWC family protein n=1 Tax=Paenibacillus artemisiicola TaxID=1172618 RepID=A0ABS3W2Z2_9BACL|nr:cysteine-rich CWC family protein [Paenibacillus artemisiicola]MBO7742678.1 cysteine-rich CWC family protein [Paenibacillus artemisiicola]